MSPNNTLDGQTEDRDRRRPISWDWLLCFLAPISVIAYHHRRVSLSLHHVFGLVLAAFISNVASSMLTLMWLRDFLAETVKKAGNDGLIEFLQSASVEQRNQLISDYLSKAPQWGLVTNVDKLLKVFVYAIRGVAMFVVFKAKVSTELARQELMESYLLAGSTAVPSTSAHPVLSSPKGTGSAFMSYAIAVMFPSASYALNADRRRVYYGIALLTAALQLPMMMLLISAVSIKAVADPEEMEVASVASTRAMLGAAALGLMILMLPVRMAIQNVSNARQRYAKTLTLFIE